MLRLLQGQIPLQFKHCEAFDGRSQGKFADSFLLDAKFFPRAKFFDKQNFQVKQNLLFLKKKKSVPQNSLGFASLRRTMKLLKTRI